jgi:hypothetical protein
MGGAQGCAHRLRITDKLIVAEGIGTFPTLLPPNPAVFAATLFTFGTLHNFAVSILYSILGGRHPPLPLKLS